MWRLERNFSAWQKNTSEKEELRGNNLATLKIIFRRNKDVQNPFWYNPTKQKHHLEAVSYSDLKASLIA